MGIVLEPEELVNTIFYLREGELGTMRCLELA